MALISNVEYLWKKCNQLMGTNYSDNRKNAINIEYVFDAANKIDEDGIQTEPNFRSQLTNTNQFIAVDTTFVNNVLNCVSACARSCHSCAGTCYGGCGSCGGCTGGCVNSCLSGCSGCTDCTGQRAGG